jgi:hypothetical protein
LPKAVILIGLPLLVRLPFFFDEIVGDVLQAVSRPAAILPHHAEILERRTMVLTISGTSISINVLGFVALQYGAAMAQRELYEQEAKACAQAAEKMRDPETRAVMLGIALCYMKLADLVGDRRGKDPHVGERHFAFKARHE